MHLEEAAIIRSGLVLARKQARETSACRYPLLNLRSIEPNGTINTDTLDIFYATEPLNPDYLTQEEDIIIRLSAPYTPVLIDRSTAGMVISSYFTVIRTDRDILIPRFLYWLLNTQKVKKQLYENTTNNMLGTINTKFFNQFEVHAIPIRQQKKLAALYILARRENQLLLALAEAKNRYYTMMIDKAHKEMKRGMNHDNEK